MRSELPGLLNPADIDMDHIIDMDDQRIIYYCQPSGETIIYHKGKYAPY